MSNNSQNEKKKFFKSIHTMTTKHWTLDDSQVTKSIKVVSFALLTLLSVFVLVKIINEVKTYNTIGEVAQSPYMITVYGKGEVKATRDLTTLSFTSSGKGKSISDAQGMAAEKNNNALAFLRAKGIDDKDISTQSYNTYPIYDQKVRPCEVEGARTTIMPAEGSMGMDIASVAPIAPCNNYEQVITGYETSQVTQLKIRGVASNPSLSGEIVAGLGEIGVQVGYLSNVIENKDELKNQARQLAIAQARVEAMQIAKSLGVHLGKVVSFNDDGGYTEPMVDAVYMSAETKMSPAPEMPTGETKITSSVSVTFEIRD